MGSYDVAAARQGTPYEGGGTQPAVSSAVAITLGNTTTRNFALPGTGRLHVTVTDADDAPLPARVTVVGFDPSPEPIIPGTILFGFSGSALGLFNDPSDRAALRHHARGLHRRERESSSSTSSRAPTTSTSRAAPSTRCSRRRRAAR